MVPTLNMFQCRASLGLGSFVFRAMLLCATSHLFTIVIVVLSPSVNWISEGLILRGN